MSLIFALAADLHRDMRNEFRAALQAEISKADDACHGYLLNKLGKSREISADSLFTGSEKRAYLYASPELVTYWQTHGRFTQAAYEAAFVAARGEELAILGAYA